MNFAYSREELSLDEMVRCAEVANRIYELGERQVKVGQALHIGQAQVARMLKKGRDYGVYRIEILPLSQLDELKNKLEEKFDHLDQVLIEPVLPVASEKDAYLARLGMRLAQYLVEEQAHGCKIGLSCGNALRSFVEALGKMKAEGKLLPHGCKVYSMLVLMMSDVFAMTPAAIGTTMINTLPRAGGLAFQFPTLDDASRITIDDYEQHRDVQKLFSELQECDYYFVGLGHLAYSAKPTGRATDFPSAHVVNDIIHKEGLGNYLQELGAIMESVHQPCDAYGKPVINDDTREGLAPLLQSTLSLSLEVLRGHVEKKTAKVCAIAGGEEKHAAILAGLRGKLFNVLVTDPFSAQYALHDGAVPHAGDSAS